jgi:HAD superfamily hydrolase (TIGR01509 family)
LHPSASRPLSGILFDIDGTLVNTDPIHLAVFQELLLKEDGFKNTPIDEAFYSKNMEGRQNALIIADLFPEWSIRRREDWELHKEARFREMAAASMMERKMPGLDTLRSWILQNNLPRAAVTNAPRLSAEAMIAGIQYDDAFFQALVIGDECEHAKPDPLPYLLGAKLIGVDPQECIVFEDSPSGARAGVAAGAYVVGILSGQDRSTLLDAGCSLLIQDYDDPALWAHLESRVLVKTS